MSISREELLNIPQAVDWLRGLADKGGKGVVNNIDARCLGRVANTLARLAATPKAVVTLPIEPTNEILDALAAACLETWGVNAKPVKYVALASKSEWRERMRPIYRAVVALPSVLGGVDQQETQTTKPSPSSTSATATETAGRAVIEDGHVVIRFPLDAMQGALDGAWGLNIFDVRQKITDINEFAEEFCNELNAESENGTTLIHRMADRAFLSMMEQGAFGFEPHEEQEL